MKKLFVLFISLFLIGIVNAQITNYNFTWNNSGQTAYTVSADTVNRLTLGTQATVAQYTALSLSDTSYAQYLSAGKNFETVWRFNFTLNETTTNIIWINASFTGYENASEAGTAYIYNFTSGAWVSMGTIGAGTNTITTVNYTDSASQQLVSATNQIIIAVEGLNFDNSDGDVVFADSARLLVGSVDNSFPIFTNYGGTTNNTAYNGNRVFNVTITNHNGTALLQINGTNYTTTNTSNVFTTTISGIPAGKYPYVWYAWGNGTDKNLNSSQSQDYYIAKATPTGSLASTKGWTFVYDGTITTVSLSESNSGDGDVVYKIYQNGTDKSSSDTKSSGGTYNYVLNTTGGQNYSASANLDTEVLSITKATTALGITGTTPIIYGTLSNFVGTDCPALVSCTINQTNAIFGVGTITINFSTEGNENYTSNWTIKDLVVNQDTTNQFTVLFNESSPIVYPNAFLVYSYATTNFKLYRNNTLISNASLQGLNVGTYNFTAIRDDTQNYSYVYNEQTFQVDGATDTCSVFFNETSPIVYPASFLVWTSCTSPFNLYKDGTPINNNTAQELAVGTYNFTVIRTDQVNYTNIYDEENFVISSALPPTVISHLFLTGTNNHLKLSGTNSRLRITG